MTSSVAAGVAAVAGRSLVLVFHRVRPEPALDHEVVPCVPLHLFHAQLAVLRTLGDVVPLEELLVPQRGRRPRFAVTFDDDYSTHVRHVLPVVRRHRIPVTFFLSGRSLHGVGPYWWQVLEEWLSHDTPNVVAQTLDVPPGGPQDIAAACRSDPSRQAYLADRAGRGDELSPGGIADLAEAGATVGFHTVAHPDLAALSGPDRREALTYGRAQLERATGHRLSLLAYPYGSADAAAAADVRGAGFTAAWTGRDVPMSRRSNPWLLGRWEAGAVDGRTLRARAVARLLRRGGTTRG